MNEMDMIDVKSSNISSVGYDADEKKLRVKFKSGRTYEYDGIEESTHEDFISAKSIGGFFHKNIRGKNGRKV